MSDDEDYFDEGAANKVCEFFSRFLRLSTGKWHGSPFVLQQWQQDILRELFGRKRSDGLRKYRQAYIEVPKKNGKSTMLAGIVLYMLIADGEESSEIYGAANDREQSGLIFREAAKMVRASPSLTRMLEIRESTKQIFFRKTNSFYKAISSETASHEGLNASCIVYDELHASKSRELWDTLRYAGAAREQPLTIVITTAGLAGTNSIGIEQHNYAVNVLSGVNPDDTFFAKIYAANPIDDPFSEATWKAANPSYGVTIDAESFREAANEAKITPSKLNSFLRYRLNIWTQQNERFIPLHDWDLCGEEKFSLQSLRGRDCYLGVDLANKTDITALVQVFPPVKDDPNYYIIPHFFLPSESAISRDQADNIGYQTWHRQGHIELTEGNMIDLELIRKRILEINDLYPLKEIVIDPWNAAGISTNLLNDGMNVISFGQSTKNYSPACKELEGLVRDRRIRHNNHPVLRWMANNVTIERDSYDNIRPSKKRSGEKIDGITAMLAGLARVILAPTEELAARSGYEDRGLVFI